MSPLLAGVIAGVGIALISDGLGLSGGRAVRFCAGATLAIWTPAVYIVSQVVP